MGKDASTIRQEIEQTRAQLGDTVEALAYKTDVPARVKDNVNDRVEAVKGTIGNVMDSVKTAVVGASDSVSSTAADAGASFGAAVDSGSRNGASALSQARDSVNSTVAQARDTVSDTVSQARETVNKTVTQAGDQLQNVDLGGNARRAVGAVQENPVGLAIAALAMGFLAGSLIPVSEAERRRMAPLRDKIVDQAQAATSDLVAAGKAVAFDTLTSAAATAKNSAQSHGQDVVDAAKQRAADG